MECPYYIPCSSNCYSQAAGPQNEHIPKSFLDIRTRCNSIPGLTREQIKLCYQATDVTAIALDGLDLAINECQLQVGQAKSHTLIPSVNSLFPSFFSRTQFQSYRWNCSSLSKKSRNPHSSTLLKRGKWTGA